MDAHCKVKKRSNKVKKRSNWDKLFKKMKEIEERVQCGYLVIGIFWLARYEKKQPYFSTEGYTIQCFNPKCGPKMECDIHEGRSCEYRSLQADDALHKQPDFDPF